MWEKIKDIFKLPLFILPLYILLIAIGLTLLAIQHGLDKLTRNFNIWKDRV